MMGTAGPYGMASEATAACASVAHTQHAALYVCLGVSSCVGPGQLLQCGNAASTPAEHNCTEQGRLNCQHG